MSELDKKYDYAKIEKKFKEKWAESGVYSWDETKERSENFVIDTPPPTVSGLLHMGHVFSYVQADYVARFFRMKGKNIFYPMGFDDNGLPTERLVEKVKKIKASQMERKEFVAICKEVVQESEEEFRDLFKTIALSVDWSQEYQTISDHSKRISQSSFLDLLQKNSIYRKMQPTLWDPVDATALAQADIVDQEFKGVMHEIEFGVKGELEKIVIATTRPELIPACVAVFCHPEDERYQSLIGKTAITPIFGVHLPIIADEAVDIEKGTGLVMCATFGDIMDIEWWKKHSLPLRVILNKFGKIEIQDFENWPIENVEKFKNAAAKFQNLKVKDARDLMKIELGAHLLKETEVTQMVKCAERSGAPLEILVTPQWFVKILDQKEALLEKVNQCNWNPPFMKHRLEIWINGLNWDWCISRQRFFGVPFPVWYSKRQGEEGKIILPSKEDLPIDPTTDLPKGYQAFEVEPDFDVMDTWATSSVTPQLNSHSISEEFAFDRERHAKIFPADLRPQAHEIIRSWAFYTIVKAHLHENTIPWKNLMISGWCLAKDKTKMSKSKGNVVTPIALINEQGTDVVRYWASTSKLGADTAYSEDVMKIGQKLVNKIWNASKFVSLQIGNADFSKFTTPKLDIESGMISRPVDLWIIEKLAEKIEKCTKEFEKFEYSNARAEIEEFFWKDFCDNYLEIVKNRAYDEAKSDLQGQISAQATLFHILKNVLKLFAPFLPFITDELYEQIFGADHSIHMCGNWPKLEEFPNSKFHFPEGDMLVSLLDLVRKYKSEHNLSPKSTLQKIEIMNLKGNAAILSNHSINDFKNVTNALEIEFRHLESSDIQGEDFALKIPH